MLVPGNEWKKAPPDINGQDWQTANGIDLGHPGEQDVLRRLADKIGRDKVQKFMDGVDIYLLPSMDFAKSYAIDQGEPDLKVKGFYVAWMKEIWINAEDPPNAWKNSLIHEIGHRYDYYCEEQTGLKASRELYSDYYRDNAAKDYFNALRWFEDPPEWFAEAFKIRYGYPGQKGYSDADEIFEKETGSQSANHARCRVSLKEP